ncbi:unnamed protein product [Rotaria socialis]|nr:unnamed protein product [Rotaria socialis]CAF4480182.1 unnamed protein product [Rotaria socialis]
MHSFTILLLCLVATLTLSKVISRPGCGPLCAMYCEYGNVMDSDGCPICQCKESPCEDEQRPLEGYFCGSGPSYRACPSTHHCLIGPNDDFAVCCPRR